MLKSVRRVYSTISTLDRSVRARTMTQTAADPHAPAQNAAKSDKPQSSSKPAKAPKTPKAAYKPSPEQIEALRAARAEKKLHDAQLKEEARVAELEAARQRAATGEVPVEEGTGRPLYVGRDWASVRGAAQTESDEVQHQARKKVRILSWNILAQGLIERKLFPGSDALKWKDRSRGLSAELVGHSYDIGCFQEVDRFEVHSETFKLHGYAFEYQRGYRAKKHGLAIVWRTMARPGSAAVFESKPAGRAVLYLDHASVSVASSSNSAANQRRTAVSRETRNIALFVAIRFAAPQKGGVIVATTHAFWHPKHSYERARQIGVLIRELDRFRRRPGAEWAEWDCILAGDFNDQPDSATYELATGRPQLRAVAIDEVASSTCVHATVDDRLNAPTAIRPSSGLVDVGTGEVADLAGSQLQRPNADSSSTQTKVASEETSTEGDKAVTGTVDGDKDQRDDQVDGEGEGEDEEEGEGEGEGEAAEEEHEDRMLKNCRPARASDGLLTLDELRQLYDLSQPPPSVEGAHDPDTTPDQRVAFKNSAPGRPIVGLRSTYGSFYDKLQSSKEDSSSAAQTDHGDDADGLEAGNFFGSASRGRERWNDPNWTKSEHIGDGYEPMWTIFSPLFSLTLDYIFLFPRISDSEPKPDSNEPEYPSVTALLRTHRTEVLQPGTPRKYVSASDHVAIGAEVLLK